MSDRRPLHRLAPPAGRLPLPFEIPFHCAEWNLRQGMALVKWQSALLRFCTDRIAADGATMAGVFGLAVPMPEQRPNARWPGAADRDRPDAPQPAEAGDATRTAAG